MRHLLLVGLVTLAVAANASAGTVTTKFTGLAGGASVSVAITDASNVTKTYNGAGGAFKHLLTVNDEGSLPFSVNDTFVAFCIEFTETITNGSEREYAVVEPQYAPNNNEGYGRMGADGQSDLELLFGSSYWKGWSASNWSSDAYAIAFQLAVWEVVYENAIGDPTSYDIDAGNFDVTYVGSGLDQATVLDLAQDMLDYVDGAGSGAHRANLVSLTRPYTDPLVKDGGQDYVVPVPLPPAAFLGLALLGGVGTVRWWRRRPVSV